MREELNEHQEGGDVRGRDSSPYLISTLISTPISSGQPALFTMFFVTDQTNKKE